MKITFSLFIYMCSQSIYRQVKMLTVKTSEYTQNSDRSYQKRWTSGYHSAVGTLVL